MRTETVIKMTVQRMTCTACGAEANASCNCGKPYMPAKQRAAEAIAANPQKSNRAIADEIGVSEYSVRDARKSGAMDHAPERLGRDGKVYRLPVREQEQSIEDFEAEVEPQNKLSAFILRADQAKQFAAYSGKITNDVLDAARLAAAAWNSLVQQLEQRS